MEPSEIVHERSELRRLIAMQQREKPIHVRTEFGYSDDGEHWRVGIPRDTRHAVRTFAAVDERLVIRDTYNESSTR